MVVFCASGNTERYRWCKSAVQPLRNSGAQWVNERRSLCCLCESQNALQEITRAYFLHKKRSRYVQQNFLPLWVKPKATAGCSFFSLRRFWTVLAQNVIFRALQIILFFVVHTMHDLLLYSTHTQLSKQQNFGSVTKQRSDGKCSSFS